MPTAYSMDSFTAELNPCSVESIPEPVEVADGRRVWPIMLGCYQLQEDGTRQGRLELYSVQVPDLDTCTKNGHSMLLRFGQPQVILAARNDEKQEASGGILDGKWIRASSSCDNLSWWYATAHSTGEIIIHSCSVPGDNDEDVEYLTSHPEAPFAVRRIGSTKSMSSQGRPSLCLSLNWNKSSYSDSQNTCSMISSYSDGRVAVHDVAYSEHFGGRLHIMERESWEAHTLFTTPAEVWSACFAGIGDTTVFSCGDDGSLKFWDLRCIHRPLQVLKHFDAGITVVTPHPRHEHLLACGSYDETICLYDVRYLTPKKPLGRSAPLGGGIWRLKWHPYDDTRFVVAAMHGGCRIVRVDELQGVVPVMSATKEFTEHKSMAYGADWLVCSHPTQEGYFEAAASCSFYDKAVHLWDTVV